MALTKIGAGLFKDTLKTNVSGALGDNATLIRSLTEAGVSGSFSQTHLSSKISGIVSGAAQIADNISGSFSQTHLSSKISGIVSASVLSSPAQGTIRLATNGVNNDVDSGLQAGDSPTFAGGTVTGNLTVGGTLTAQEIHTEFTSASIMFSSGSTKFGDTIDDTHEVTGSMTMSGSVTVNDGNLIVTDNIGIGTSTVVSQLHLAKTSGEFGIKLTNNATGHTSSDGAHFNLDANNDLNLGTKDSTNIVFETADSERVRIKSDGKMGIGTNNPNELLHVEGSSPSIRIKASNEGGEPELKLQSDQGDDHDDLFSIRAVNEHALNIINFTGDTATSMMFISGSGQVGIGTTQPDAKLKVEEDTHGANVQIKMRAQNDSGAGRTFAITADPDARSLTMGEVGEFVLISDGSNDVLSMGSSTLVNRVGQPLAVTSGGGSNRGGIAINSFLADTNGPLVDFNRSRNNTIGQHTSVNSGDGLGAFIFRGSDGDEYVDSAAIVAEVDGSPGNNDMPGRLQFFTTPDGTNSLVERMRITNTGAIGINTTSPSALLHVSGSQGSGAVALFERKNGADNTSYMVQIKNDDTTSNQGAGLNVQAGNDSGDVTFNAVTRDGTFGLRVIGDGRVGVGLSDPEARLQVNPGVSDNTLAAIDMGYGIEFNGNTGGHVGLAVIDGSAGRGKNRGFIGFRGNSASSMGHSHIVFATAPGVADDPAEIMRITTTGKVGIGQDDPSAGKLEIRTSSNGERALQLTHTEASVDNQDEIMRCSFSGTGDPTGGRFIAFEDSSARMGDIGAANGTNVSYTVGPSDKNLKKNFEDWDENVLEHFKNLKPQKFNYKRQADTDEKLKGYIAQDVKDVFPEAYPLSKVKEEDEWKDYYYFNPSGMIVYLMKAVQELTSQVDVLKAQISGSSDFTSLKTAVSGSN